MPVRCIFVLGTAGSGKSLLAHRLHQYYLSQGVFPALLNLDPGAESLPYTPDVDVRDHVDVVSVMRRYDLGPNGGLVMANDMTAARLDDIQGEVGAVNPDYLVVDTPGQVELFAYRSSGPFLTSGMAGEAKTALFLFDGAMMSGASNYISVSLLAASIRLRVGLSCINVLSKSDIAAVPVPKILEWAADSGLALEDAASESPGRTYSLMSAMVYGMDEEYPREIIPVSGATGDGMADLESALSRILNMGEEVED